LLETQGVVTESAGKDRLGKFRKGTKQLGENPKDGERTICEKRGQSSELGGFKKRRVTTVKNRYEKEKRKKGKDPYWEKDSPESRVVQRALKEK